MVRILQIILLLLAPISLIAQSATQRILVRNAGAINGKQTISIKWYSKDLLYTEGVNLYRKEGKGEWQKLNTKPIKRLDSLPAIEFIKDQDLHFFVPLIRDGKKEDLKGLFMINVLVKSFQSEVFSRFLGIQFEDSTVKAGKTYTYRVNSIKGNSEALLGESVSITAGQETIEEAIKDIELKVDTSKVKMKWRPEENRFYAVNIYKETESNEWNKLNKVPVMISKFKDSLGRYQYPKVFFMQDSLKPGFYTYQFAGVDFFGKETKRSESFKVEVKDLFPPPSPEDLKDSINNLDVFLKWTNRKSDDIKGINVYRSIKSSGPFTKLNSNLLPISTASYKDKVEKAGPYYYYVSSVDAAGNEGKSQPVFAEVHDIVPPAKPLGLVAKADTGRIVLTWQKNKEGDLKGYLIYRTVNKNDKNYFALLSSEAIKENTYSDKLPRNAKNKFLYKVIAIDTSFNKSEASEIAMAQMPDVTPPVKPLLKSVTNVENTIQIEWIENRDADLKGYNIFRSDKGNYTKLNQQIIPATEKKYFDKNIESSVNYFYYLTAIDSSGNESQPSNTIKGNNNFVVVKSAPELKVKYREDKKDVHITWKREQSENVIGYTILRREGDSKMIVPVSGQLNTDEFYDKDIKEGKTYYYELQVLDKGGNTSKSETIKIAIKTK